MRLLRVVLTLGLICAGSSGAWALSYRLLAIDDGRCGTGRPCPTAIVATGEISEEEFDLFRAFVASAAPGTQAPRDFIIHSNGGNVGGALKLGLALRVLGLNTVVGAVRGRGVGKGFCGSACVFVLMGGRTRRVAPGSTVAVHSPRRVVASVDPEVVGSTELRSGLKGQVLQGLMDYARGMGVDPVLIRLSMTVPHHSRRVLTAAEIRRFRLASTTSRP
jgi:hypothetical protein